MLIVCNIFQEKVLVVCNIFVCFGRNLTEKS